LARQQRNVRLQTRDARRKLPGSHEPVWHEVRRGLYLGYRKGSSGGVWWLREYREGHYTKRRLGIADDDIDADGAAVLSWPDVLKQVLGEERPTLNAAGSSYTINQALEDYFAHRRAKSPLGSVETDRSKAKAFIPVKLAQRKLSEVATQELLRWRDGMVIPRCAAHKRPQTGAGQFCVQPSIKRMPAAKSLPTMHGGASGRFATSIGRAHDS
jgi:hypothetical protein